MAREKSLASYVQSQHIDPIIALRAQQTIEEWRRLDIPLWKQEDKRDDYRAALIIARAVSKNDPVQFFAPVCPDYPADSRSAQLGVGLGGTIPPVLSLVKNITTLLKDRSVPYKISILLADTETDLPEVVALLANSVDDFLGRCRQTVVVAQKAAPDLFYDSDVQIVPFTEYFDGQWHTMQYFWEKITCKKTKEDSDFNLFLNQLTPTRTKKYEKQFGRHCSMEECFGMAVRHYAQYHALGYWMRQYHGSVMINTNSPNLRAIRRPFVLGETPTFLPTVPDQQTRIPVIIL